MADIFISYSRTDRPRVQLLADALSAHGWTVWWDRQISAGKTFDHVIAEALTAARCVVVVWSESSIASDWVREEADEGRRRNILVPVLFDGARPPLGFGRIQAADLGDWHGDTTTDAFRRLIADITAMLGAPSTAAGAGLKTGGYEEPGAVLKTGGYEEPVPGPKTGGDAEPVERSRRSLDRPQAPRPRTLWIGAGAVVALIVLVLLVWFIGGRGSGQPSPTTSASDKPALGLGAMLARDGEALTDGVSYEVFEAAQNAAGERKRVAASSSYSGPPRFPLPPGRYYVTAAAGAAKASTEVEVSEKTLVQQVLVLHAGVLRPVAHLTPSAPPLDSEVSYTVFAAAVDAEGNRTRVASSPDHAGPPRFTLQAGRYYVSAQHGRASTSQEVDIGDGDNKALALDLKAGVLLPSAVLSDGSKPLESGVAYAVDEAEKDVEGRAKRVASSPDYAGPPRLPLPAGRLTVTATHGSAVARSDVDLAPGEIKRLVLNLRAGILKLTSTGATGQTLATGVSYEVHEATKDAEGKRRRVATSPNYAGPPTFQVPRGRYYVTASAGAVSAEAEVEVPEGVITPVTLTLARSGQNSR